VRATKFEFERRFWIITGIYAVGFSLSNFDHVRAITALRRLIEPSLPSDSAQAIALAQVVIAAGALLVFLAAALRTWAAAYLRTDVVHDTDQRSETLVADGPFRYVRNPLYFSSVPMAAGIGVLASRAGWLFLVGATWLFVYRLIFREEESASAKPRRIVSRLLRCSPALLAIAHVARAGGESRSAMGSGFRGGEFCLDLRIGGVVNCSYVESLDRTDRVSARICRAFSCHTACA
jgi:protein-S-isoprenylcysteine O-methyltransferase Ste14